SGDDLFSQALSAPDYLHAEMELLLASAYTVPQQHFSSYLTAAVSQMRNEGIDAQTALQEQEVKALANLQAADDRRETVSVAVATPIPQFTGEGVVINFGIQSILPQIANQAQWNTLAENFAAN